MSTIGEQLVHVDRQTGVTRVYGVVVLDAENSP